MKWPTRIRLIRHGESAYNLMKPTRDKDPKYQRFKALYREGEQNGCNFSDEARELAKEIIEKYALKTSDPETPLTPLGHRQAFKTGRGLSKAIELPDVVFVSSYLRTGQTLDGLVKGWPKLKSIKRVPDERLRERNIGLLEIYNDWRMLNVLHPEQALLHRLQGEFYYRYPQGESIVDVQSRIRQWLQTITREFSGASVLVVTHHLTILSIRSLLERWTPKQFIHVDNHDKPKNCSVTTYRGDPKQGSDGKLVLDDYNRVYY